MAGKPCIAVVSPFLDKQHGTERCVVEQLERLADEFEFHVYSARVEGLNLKKIMWHRIPEIPGPHLIRYLGFLLANHFRRWWDRYFQKLHFDLVYSPGINCIDADVIAVHIVFAEFYQRVHKELSLRRNPLRFWPRLIHRRLSYNLFIALERLVYVRKDLRLTVTSHKMANDLARLYTRCDNLSLAYNGIDLNVFNPNVRARLRHVARTRLQVPESTFLLLLVGNDWKKKGLPCLLEAIGRLKNQQLCLAVVGRDDQAPYASILSQHRLAFQVKFLLPRPDVEFYYAASDAYVGPSLEDAFALPPLEAMACGLPVIVSRQAGVSEIISDGVDGLILEDPADASQLAELIGHLFKDTSLRKQLGDRAVKRACQFTWDLNTRQVRTVFEQLTKERRESRPDRKQPVPMQT